MPIPDAMGASFGASFAPTREAAAAATARPGPSPLQQAVQVLSLRLPQVLQGAPAPAELLTAPRGQGANLASAVVQSVLRSVLGGQQAPGAFPAPRAGLPAAAPGVGAPTLPGLPTGLPGLPDAGGLPAPRRRPELQALMELLNSIGLGGGGGGGGAGTGGGGGAGRGPRVEFAEPVVIPDQAFLS